MSVTERVGASRESSGQDMSAEGRFGPRSAAEQEVRIGGVAQGVFDVASGAVSLGEDVCTIGCTLAGSPMPTSAVVLGGFGSLCHLIAGMQPLEGGFRLVKESKGAKGVSEDTWGVARGLSKITTGATSIVGSAFNVFSRMISAMTLWGAPMLPQLVAIGAVAGTVGALGGIVVMLSMIGFSLISIMEGQMVRREVAEIIEKSGSSNKKALECLRERLGKDSLFVKRLKRTTKQKVLDEIRDGKLVEKTRVRLAKNKHAVDPVWDPEGAVLQHIFMKLDKRQRLNQGMIALGVISGALIGAGLVVGGGVPLIVVSALGIVATLVWLCIDVPGLIKAVKKGDAGSLDRVVLIVTSLMLVGLIAASALLSTTVLGLIVMASIAGACIALHLWAMWSLQKAKKPTLLRGNEAVVVV